MDTAVTGRAGIQHQPPTTASMMVLPNNQSFENDDSSNDAGILSSSAPTSTPFNITSTSPSISTPNLQHQQSSPANPERQQKRNPMYEHRKMSRRISIQAQPSSAAQQANSSAAHVLLDWLQGSFDNHRQLMSETDSGLLLDNCHPWVHINIKPIILASSPQQQQKSGSNVMPPMSYIEYADNNPLHATRTQLLVFSPLAGNDAVKNGKVASKQQPICMQMFDVENAQLEQLTKKLQEQQQQQSSKSASAKSAMRYRTASLDFDCSGSISAGIAAQNMEIAALMANAKQITTIIWHVYEKQDKFLGFIQNDAATSCIRRPNFVNHSSVNRSRSVNHDNNTAPSPLLSNGHHDNETDDGFSDDAVAAGSGSVQQPKSSWMSSSSRFPTQNKQHYSSINASAADAQAAADDVMLNDIMAAKEDGMMPDLILSLNELFIANSHIISRFQPPNSGSNFLSSSTTSADGLVHQHILRPFLSDCLIPYFHFRRCSLYSGSIEMSEDKSALDAVSDADRLSIKQIILHDQGDRATLIGARTGIKYQVELAVVPWLDRDGLRIAVYEADNDMPCAMTVTAESQYIQLSLSWLNIRFVYCDDYIEMFNNIHDNNSKDDEAFEPAQEKHEEEEVDNVTNVGHTLSQTFLAVGQSTPVAPTTAAAV